MRGLKSYLVELLLIVYSSDAVSGAWIEIVIVLGNYKSYYVASRKGCVD